MSGAIGTHSRIYVAGSGMVGTALVRALRARGYANLVTRTHRQLDLTDQAATHRFVRDMQPEYIFVSAAKVGGILANDTFRGDFIYDNLMIQSNLIHAALEAGVRRLLFLGSSCVYPRDTAQPIREDQLLTGPFEPTNEPYAVAKVAGMKLCESFNRQHGTRYVSVMPSNLYGPNDNFDLASSHLLPALLHKAHVAKRDGKRGLNVWGSGRPRREWLYVNDLADACLHLMEQDPEPGIYNVGAGQDLTVAELAQRVMQAVGLEGAIEYDMSKPDGMQRKLLDSSRMRALGWQPRTSLSEGIAHTYEWCLRSGVFEPERAVA
jgi:GDP-L-fucose synthase